MSEYQRHDADHASMKLRIEEFRDNAFKGVSRHSDAWYAITKLATVATVLNSTNRELEKKLDKLEPAVTCAAQKIRDKVAPDTWDLYEYGVQVGTIKQLFFSELSDLLIAETQKSSEQTAEFSEDVSGGIIIRPTHRALAKRIAERMADDIKLRDPNHGIFEKEVAGWARLIEIALFEIDTEVRKLIEDHIVKGPTIAELDAYVAKRGAPIGEKPMKEPMLQHFTYAHLPDELQLVSKPICELAHHLVETLPRNPERTVALRKLLEAKDCAVRARLYKEE